MPRTATNRYAHWTAATCVLGMLLCASGSAAAASFAVHLETRDGTPLKGAVLTLDPQSSHMPAAAPVNMIVNQIDLSFVPDITVIPVGSTISFPNTDAVSHQVYSFSSAHRFQLPLYRGKPYPPIPFDQPGVVTLGCNIHDNMLAYVVVTAAPFFGRTDAKGEWLVPAVPTGTYRLTLWHPLLSESAASLERTVQLVGADRTDVSVKLARALRPAPITSRPHSWDY